MTFLREAIGAGRRGPLPGQGRGPGEPWEGLVEETPQVWAVWLAEYWRSKTRRPLPEVPPIWLTMRGRKCGWWVWNAALGTSGCSCARGAGECAGCST